MKQYSGEDALRMIRRTRRSIFFILILTGGLMAWFLYRLFFTN